MARPAATGALGIAAGQSHDTVMSYFQPIDKEEQLVLILALYILERLDNRKPTKRQVLRLIRARELLVIHDGDSEIRSTGEEKLDNDLAWAREDAKERGFLTMPEIGVWQLTNAGREWLLKKAEQWRGIYEKDPESMNGFLRGCQRINAVTFTHMVLIGRGIDVTKRPKELLGGDKPIERQRPN
ncbi:MAG TPA: winged helix-turn-helix domain-containing protein [Lacipirellulaceae bacterium]|nr:winged helix-turn-helix domain-containing protein [Lacipirellulaceae bacterium]